MSFDEPGKFFDGRPGDSFTPGALRASSEARSAESHARHERWQQEKAIRLAEEADTRSKTELAAMAKNDARAFALAVAQFRSMMEICFPDLVALTTQQQIPKSSSLFPVAACLGSHGPCWMHPVPEGDKDGDALVWSKDDHAWLPGEVAGGYDGEFALYLDGTKLKVKEGHVCVNGLFNHNPCYVPTTVVVDTANLKKNEFVHVYLCAYQGTTQTGAPVREERPGIPALFVALVETSNSGQGVRGYIDLGTYQEGAGIKQNYLGGSGAQIVVGLPHCGPVNGGGDQQLLKWNALTETWQAGYLTAIE